MDEQFILRVPPSVAEQIERLMNESAAGSSSNPDDASLDLSFSVIGRLECVDSRLVKVKIYVYILLICRPHNHFKLEQMIMAELVHRVEKDLISIMQGVPVSILLICLCIKFFNLFIDQNVGVAGGGEGGDRKKAAPAPAPKPDVQEPAANGEEAEADRSDSDESDS
ncbi:hypothetical protein TRIUR3_28839 [Triticum urartu]|uniref:Transcription initiation factor TFIID subunit 7 n=2 Tax=Triticum TaxID=4564 RepID=A0A9R0VKN0_TRITD|nr:hypothetical protein TRIUR3_28839 [Triticum urartu]VAH62028.1 unnamed protein product [Triticum turgidum subsp. durum]